MLLYCEVCNGRLSWLPIFCEIGDLLVPTPAFVVSAGDDPEIAAKLNDGVIAKLGA